MSELKLDLLDSHTTLVGTVHGSIGDRLVAALSAEPETIEELEAALKRFEKDATIFGFPPCRGERCDIDDEPYDAGILVIDLAARIVACNSTYSLPGRDGVVEYHDGTQSTGFPLSYRLSNDWIFLRSIEEYPALAEHRRQERGAVVPVNTRTILYGEPLLDFIVQNVRLLNTDFKSVSQYTLACREVSETLADVKEAPDVERALACCDSPNPKLSSGADLLAEAVIDIHRRWLMTPRDDLNGQSPREILFAKRELIDFDINSRANQWSYFLEEPPSLSRDSYAYRYGGFGTHEWVMYYDLVRFLIWAAVNRVAGKAAILRRTVEETFCTEAHAIAATTADKHSTLLADLERLKIDWLSEPNSEGYVPFEIIDNERRRRPEAMSGRSMVVDEDCPCCKMMGDESEAGLGIYFCHFDGSHMEYEFAFSWCATLEEWEKEQSHREEWDRERDRKQKEREEKIARGEISPDAGWDIPF
jgi:hypothetical protein